MLKKKDTTILNQNNTGNMENEIKSLIERKIKVNGAHKKNKEHKNNSKLKIMNNFCDLNYKTVEIKNKKNVKPLALNDLQISINDDKSIKLEEYMTNFLDNIFENDSALFLYCKYVLLFYGKHLISDNIDSLRFEVIKGGITNILVKVLNTSQEKKYLIRLYGPKTNEIINREREKKISNILCDINISKKIYIFFPNGRIEEYMEGRALSNEDIKEKKFQKKIAEKLRILHHIDIGDNLLKNIKNSQNFDSNENSSLWSTVWKYFNILNEDRNTIHSFSSKKNILKLIDFKILKSTIIEVERLCYQKQSPVVLCHCDLLSSNIIIRKDESIYFIDFEYSCPMERAYDIANHFMEYAGFNCKWHLIPSKSEEYNFIKHYLQTNDDNLIYKLIDEIQPFYLASHIMWGLWALLQAMYSTIDFDFVNYAMLRLSALYSPLFRSKIDNNI